MTNATRIALRSAWLAPVVAIGLGLPAHAQQRKSAIVPISVLVRPMAEIVCPEGFNFHLYVPPENKHDDKKGKGHQSHGNGNGYGHDNHGSSGPRLIIPAVIPFKVIGNTVATLSARPDQFLRIKSGSYLGKAVPIGSGNSHQTGNSQSNGNKKGNGHGSPPPVSAGPLGYNIIMQFPIASWSAANPSSWEALLVSFLSGFASLTGLNNQGTFPLSANLAQRPGGTYGVLYIVSRDTWTADGSEAAQGKYGGTVELTLTPLNN